MTYRSVFETAITILACSLLATDSTFADEETRVFIFAGQSNMVGADAITERIDAFPDFKGAGTPQKDVHYSYILGNGDEASPDWTPLKPLRSFGPEVTFARRVKQRVKYPIAIITDS